MSIAVWLEKQKKRNEKLENIKKYFDKQGYTRCDVSLLHKDDNRQLQEADDTVLKFIDSSNRVKVLRRDFTDSLLQELGPILQAESLRIQYEGSIFYKNSDNIIEENQIGIELIGADNLLSDLEILKSAQCLSRKVEGMLVMSHSGYLKSLLSDLNPDENQHETLLKIMALKNRTALNHLDLEDKLLNICKHVIDYETLDIDQLIEIEINDGRIKALEALRYLKTQLGDQVVVDLSMSQKYQYYEGMICQVYVEGSNKSVIRGGRYLYFIDGKEIPAVGFSIDVKNYMERGRDENCIV